MARVRTFYVATYRWSDDGEDFYSLEDFQAYVEELCEDYPDEFHFPRDGLKEGRDYTTGTVEDWPSEDCSDDPTDWIANPYYI